MAKEEHEGEIERVLGGLDQRGSVFGARGLANSALVRTSASVRGVSYPNWRTIGGKPRLGASQPAGYVRCSGISPFSCQRERTPSQHKASTAQDDSAGPYCD